MDFYMNEEYNLDQYPIDKLFCVTDGGIVSYKEMLQRQVRKIQIVADNEAELTTSHELVRAGVDLAIECEKKRRRK